MRKRIGRWKIRTSASSASKARPIHRRQGRGGRLRARRSSSTRRLTYFHEGKGQPERGFRVGGGFAIARGVARRHCLGSRMNPEKLFDYIEGNLPQAERAQIEEQLATDPQL